MHTQLDFLAIGDAVVDDFIRLKDAEVHCDVNKEHCTICMRFGDKVPFESSTIVYGVGNAGNAAVAATRLGLNTAFITNIGKDTNGDRIVEHYKKEGMDTTYVKQHEGVPTNYHYVLWYGDERTILVHQHTYPFTFPQNLPIPKTLYLSSLVDETGERHDAIADWLEAHRDIFFAFQPGVFEIKMGTRLARLYKRADIFFANKEEYQRILESPEKSEELLLKKMKERGVKIPILTDGRNGAYALHEGTVFHLDMFPDPAPPIQRTGAGDAFSSTTTAFLTMGLPLKDAMERGLVNAAYVVQQVGAQKGLLARKALEEHLASAAEQYEPYRI